MQILKKYLVTWEIDIEASTPEEAARKALEIQRDPSSIALVFVVKERDKPDVTVDLWE